MNWLLMAMMGVAQVAGGAEPGEGSGTEPEGGEAGAGAPDEAATPAARAESDLAALENATVSDFLNPENYLYVWNTYGIPAVKALVVLLGAWVLAGWVKRGLTKALTKAKVEVTLSKFLGNVARWAVLLIAGVSVLGVLGIETTSFAAVLAAMGFAVGLALSGSLGNLAAGVMLLLFRPFKVGDVITTSGVTGAVDEIELFSTTLTTPDNRRFIMPNGSVFNTTIENLTTNPTRRVEVSVGVAYDADIDATRAALEASLQGIGGVLADPAPAVYLDSLGDSAVAWKVRAWVKTGDFWAVRERMTAAVKQALDQRGIEIPFPQMVVHSRPPKP